MATRTHVILEDDLDGKPADRTHYIGLDGQWHAIELSKANGKALNAAIGKFLEAARKVAPSEVPGLRRARQSTYARPARTPADRQHNADIREWAMAQSPPLMSSNRGRIPGSVTAAYDAAH